MIAVVANDGPAEEVVFEFRTSANVVDDPTFARFARWLDDYANVHKTFVIQIPGNNVAYLIV